MRKEPSAGESFGDDEDEAGHGDDGGNGQGDHVGRRGNVVEAPLDTVDSRIDPGKPTLDGAEPSVQPGFGTGQASIELRHGDLKLGAKLPHLVSQRSRAFLETGDAPFQITTGRAIIRRSTRIVWH